MKMFFVVIFIVVAINLNTVFGVPTQPGDSTQKPVTSATPPKTKAGKSVHPGKKDELTIQTPSRPDAMTSFPTLIDASNLSEEQPLSNKAAAKSPTSSSLPPTSPKLVPKKSSLRRSDSVSSSKSAKFVGVSLVDQSYVDSAKTALTPYKKAEELLGAEFIAERASAERVQSLIVANHKVLEKISFEISQLDVAQIQMLCQARLIPFTRVVVIKLFQFQQQIQTISNQLRDLTSFVNQLALYYMFVSIPMPTKELREDINSALFSAEREAADAELFIGARVDIIKKHTRGLLSQSGVINKRIKELMASEEAIIEFLTKPEYREEKLEALVTDVDYLLLLMRDYKFNSDLNDIESKVAKLKTSQMRLQDELTEKALYLSLQALESHESEEASAPVSPASQSKGKGSATHKK